MATPEDQIPWIGVDFDCTLAEWHTWGQMTLGKPVPEMLERVKGWLAEGKRVKIMTARAAELMWHAPIQDWCMNHLGMILEITDKKDYWMEELWDDRAVRVEKNTGKRIL